jgi:hypothetical protein
MNTMNDSQILSSTRTHPALFTNNKCFEQKLLAKSEYPAEWQQAHQKSQRATQYRVVDRATSHSVRGPSDQRLMYVLSTPRRNDWPKGAAI